MTADLSARTTRKLLVSLPNDDLIPALGDLPPEVELLIWDMVDAPPANEINIVVPPYLADVEILGALQGVRTDLVQGQSIGYDRVDASLPSGHIFANAATVHETSTAEFALAMILAMQRGIPDFVRSAAHGGDQAAWHRPSLADRRVILVGYGGVGRAIGERLKPFDVDLVHVASKPRRDADGLIHGMHDLPDLLPRCEIAVVGVPLTADTEHLVDDVFLSALPDGALVVNVSRGKVADTAAVLAHARRGRLRFALGVTDPEPLPADHELFRLPNVLISPHVGGASSAMVPRMARLLRQQIGCLLRHEAPLNVVVRS